MTPALARCSNVLAVKGATASAATTTAGSKSPRMPGCSGAAVVLVARSWLGVLGGWPALRAWRTRESMPPEHRDTRARQREALRRYFAELGGQRIVLPRRPPSRSQHPSACGGHRSPGSCSPGSWSWWRWSVGSWSARSLGPTTGRPAGPRALPSLRDSGPRHYRRPDGLGGVQDGGRPGQRDACLRRETAEGDGRAGEDPARPIEPQALRQRGAREARSLVGTRVERVGQVRPCPGRRPADGRRGRLQPA
jgi:hypothetical protein